MSTKTISLILDSRDGIKVEGSTNHVRFNVGDQTRDLNGNVNYVQLSKAEIPVTMYNIIDSNNTLVWTQYTGTGAPTVQLSASVPVGNYTKTNLITALQTEMSNAGGDAYTVAVSSITGKSTITNSAGNDIQLLYASSEIMNVLGYRGDSAQGISVVSPYPIDLRGVRTVLVRSNIVQKAIRYSGDVDYNSYVGYVPITESFGSTVYWENNNDLDIMTEVDKIPNVIDIQLTNRFNTLIDFNEFDWKFVFLINYTQL